MHKNSGRQCPLSLDSRALVNKPRHQLRALYFFHYIINAYVVLILLLNRFLFSQFFSKFLTISSIVRPFNEPLGPSQAPNVYISLFNEPNPPPHPRSVQFLALHKVLMSQGLVGMGNIKLGNECLFLRVPLASEYITFLSCRKYLHEV